MGNTSSADSYKSRLRDPEYKWIPTREYWLSLKPSMRLRKLCEICTNENLYLVSTDSLDRQAVKLIFTTFPWPEGTTEEATNQFNIMSGNTPGYELYKPNVYLPTYRCLIERNLKYFTYLLGQEDILLSQKEVYQEKRSNVPVIQIPRSTTPENKPFTVENMTFINTTGTPLKFPSGRVIDPIPETLDIYKTETHLDKTSDGVEITGFNLESKSIPMNYDALQKYNKENTMLIIKENLAMWWVDIIEDIEWNGPIAFPIIVDGVCVNLHVVNDNVC